MLEPGCGAGYGSGARLLLLPLSFLRPNKGVLLVGVGSGRFPGHSAATNPGLGTTEQAGGQTMSRYSPTMSVVS